MDDVLKENEIIILNGTEKCKGTITRQNRARLDDMSAIDFVTTTYEMQQMVKKVIIDEDGDFRMKGKKESDHNTILIDIVAGNQVSQQPTKVTRWNLKAPPELWCLFCEMLANMEEKAKEIMNDCRLSMKERYKKWNQLIQKAAMMSVGKTTSKPYKRPKPSSQMLQLREERRQMKKNFENEKDSTHKRVLLDIYVRKQKEIQVLTI